MYIQQLGYINDKVLGSRPKAYPRLYLVLPSPSPHPAIRVAPVSIFVASCANLAANLKLEYKGSS